MKVVEIVFWYTFMLPIIVALVVFAFVTMPIRPLSNAFVFLLRKANGFLRDVAHD